MKKKLIFWFIVILCLFSIGYAQYYYFSDSHIVWFNGYQQWCSEKIDVRFNTESDVAWAGIFHLVLDDTKINYSDNAEDVLVETTTLSFPDWVSWFPKWKAWSSNTILEAERYNQSDVTATVQWDLWYWTIYFIPDYSWSSYNVDFWMDYIPGSSTIETTLSYQWSEIINSADQNPRTTTTISVLQEPCVDDTNSPQIDDNIYINWSTKVTNQWLSINLQDSVGSVNVPYVFNSVWNWIVNPGWINNQYGIDSWTIEVTIAWNGTSMVLDEISDFSWSVIWPKTWQYKDRDYNIIATSWQLFNFGVEQRIDITYYIEDRLWYSRSQSISFNHPQNPNIDNISPASNEQFVVLDEKITFDISDDWAGVDSGSIIVILSWLDNDFYWIYSWIELLLSGISWSANYSDYHVEIFHHDFPTSGTIKADVYWSDLEWNSRNTSWIFITRPDCGELGCCDSQLQTWDEITRYYYINTGLYVSWGNNPYITWLWGVTGYVDCNTQDDWLSIYEWQNNTGILLWFTDLTELVINWSDVTAILSGNILVLQKTTTSWWWGGGWWSVVPRDDCPDWDNSPSYYDWTCGTHSSPWLCNVNNSNYSSELKWAYLYSYMYGITTMCPIEDANLDGYLHRNHFAKMISEFALNVLWKEPEFGKAGCEDFDDIQWDTEELKWFIKTACELNLMWMHADGVTPKDSFYSEEYVTRAQFGTVFSRLLFGDEYNVKNESSVYKDSDYWYKNHLNALKDYGVMTMIHDDWPDKLELRGRVMLMMQRADNYWLFAWMIPVINWNKALFD